jgi:hypothetical protein
MLTGESRWGKVRPGPCSEIYAHPDAERRAHERSNEQQCREPLSYAADLQHLGREILANPET